MAPTMILFLLLHDKLHFGLASQDGVTGEDQGSIRITPHQQSKETNLDHDPIDEHNWSKTHFDWLRSQEYRDVNDFFANSKEYLDVNYLLDNAGKNNVLLQRIIHEQQQHKAREKRCLRRGRNRRNKKKNKLRKIGRSKSRSKTETGFKTETNPGKSKGATFRSSQKSRKQRQHNIETDIDLEEMDKMIMAMTFNQFVGNNEDDALEDENKNIKSNKKADKYNDQTNRKMRKGKGSNRSMGLTTSYVNDELEKVTPDAVDHMKTNMAMFGTSMNLPPMELGDYSTDFVPGDSEVDGVWLDILPTQHGKVNHAHLKGNLKSKRRTRRSVSVQEEGKTDLSSSEPQAQVNLSNVENLNYLQNTLKKLERILSSQMSEEKLKNDNIKSEQSTTKRQYGNASKGNSRTAYTVVGDATVQENTNQDFEIRFVPGSNRTSGKFLYALDTQDAADKDTATTKPEAEKTPVLTQTGDGENNQSNTKLREEQNGNEKQNADETKQELKVSNQELRVSGLEKTDALNVHRPKILNTSINPGPVKGVNNNDKKCETLQGILHVFKEFWKFVTKPNLSIVYSNNIRASMLKSAMIQISKLMDMDTLKNIENEVMKCIHPQDTTLLHMVSKIKSVLTTQVTRPFETLGDCLNNSTNCPNEINANKKTLKATEPVSKQRELPKFSTLQNIVNYNFVGNRTDEIFRNKFLSISPFSQQNKQRMAYPTGTYCSQVFKHYLSSMEPYGTKEMQREYPGRCNINGCIQLAQFAAKFRAYGPALGVVENSCMKRLVANLANCECSELPDGRTQAHSETGAQKLEYELYSDDPAPHFNSKVVTPREILFGRGKPIFRRPRQQYPRSFNPRPCNDDKRASNPKQKEIPGFSDFPIMLTQGRLPNVNNVASGEKPPMGYLSNARKAGNDNYLRQNTMPFHPRFVGQGEHSRVNPLLTLAASGKAGNYQPRPINTNNPYQSLAYPRVLTLGKPRELQGPRYAPNSPFGGARTGSESESAFRVYKPLVVLMAT